VYHRWGQVDGGAGGGAGAEWENVVVVLNFSGRDQTVDVPLSFPGRWHDLLAGFAGGPPWSIETTGTTAPVPVGSHFGRVLLGER